jgi:4a-hydroxytetrahydrobiopterin dehydratase
VGLAELQCTQIRTQPQWWERDIADLGQRLLGFGLTRLEDRGAAPPPLAAKQSLPGLTEAELTAALHELPDWEPVADALAAEYPLVRQELRRNLAFANFTEAVAFMAYAAPVFEEANHHPRWGNEWNRVQIRLSTWDAMNKITTRDVEVAKLVEDAYRRFQQRDEGE